MSFIPSILKSVPQPLSFSGAVVGTPASQLITAVDLTAAVLLFAGSSGQEGGGFVNGANHNYVKFIDSTHVGAYTAVNPSATTVIVNCIVLEFLRAMLLQDVYQNVITLNSAGSNTLNTGLTLGPKAFIVPAGYTHTYAAAASANEGISKPQISLNAATGVVTIQTRGNLTGAAETITHSFFIVDPR